MICQIEGQLVTERRDLPVCRDAEGNFVSGNGLNKLAVIERHHALGNIGLGIVQGFNIHGGAIASTVAHDSHNLVMVGDNDDDMLLAAESLRECGGGFCVVSHGIVLARLPLPIAGLMTDAPVDSVLEIQRALLDAASVHWRRQEERPACGPLLPGAPRYTRHTALRIRDCLTQPALSL